MHIYIYMCVCVRLYIVLIAAIYDHLASLFLVWMMCYSSDWLFAPLLLTSLCCCTVYTLVDCAQRKPTVVSFHFYFFGIYMLFFLWR